ncbi:MAG TPA: ABC transporter substrate-binding protein [Solirubrobacteraceae bacterium]|nr:ABC transporter substrate-binding protein [Solirubrobacteraceae bacterium]
MKRHQSWRLAALAAFCLLAVFAGSAPALAASKPKAATGPAIKIGAICTCSGPLESGIKAAKTLDEAWVKWTNANGGINGRPVKLTILDDAGDATKAAAAARQLVQQVKPVAIVGNYSLQTDAWIAIAQEAGVPVIGGGGQSRAEFSNPDFFGTGSSSFPGLYRAILSAKQDGKKKLAILYCAEAPICASFPRVISAFANRIGRITVGASSRIAASQPSFAANCLAGKNSGADASFISTSSAVVVRVLQECRQQGWVPTMIGGNGTIGINQSKQIGKSDVLITTPSLGVTDKTTAGGKLLHSILAKYAPSLTKGDLYTEAIGAPFAGLQLFATVAKNVKLKPTSTSADVKRGLYALKGETVGGLTGPLTYTRGQPTMVACSFVSTYKDGTWKADPRAKCLSAATVQSIKDVLGIK